MCFPFDAYIRLNGLIILGTPEERGLVKWQAMLNSSQGGNKSSSQTYEFPIGMDAMRKINCLRFFPLSPTFRGWGTVRDPKEELEVETELRNPLSQSEHGPL